MKTTVVLADDHPLLLEGTNQFLIRKGFDVLDTAYDGISAYNSIINLSPDIAILDFDMPKQNGLEVASQCLQNGVVTKLVILTLYKQETILKEVGVSIHGYILKDDALSELELCITEVSKGNTYISNNLNENIHLMTRDLGIKNLTATEVKILHYLAKDLSSLEIAEALFISKRTVEKHRSNIIQKLGIKSSQNALLLWVKNHPEFFEK